MVSSPTFLWRIFSWVSSSENWNALPVKRYKLFYSHSDEYFQPLRAVIKWIKISWISCHVTCSWLYLHGTFGCKCLVGEIWHIPVFFLIGLYKINKYFFAFCIPIWGQKFVKFFFEVFFLAWNCFKMCVCIFLGSFWTFLYVFGLFLGFLEFFFWNFFLGKNFFSSVCCYFGNLHWLLQYFVAVIFLGCNFFENVLNFFCLFFVMRFFGPNFL